MRVLLDTNVLSEPMRQSPHPGVMAQLQSAEHVLHTASTVIHELSYGIARLPAGRRQQRFKAYLETLLESGLVILPYDSKAALWHGEQRARLEAAGQTSSFADGQVAAIAASHHLVLITRNTKDCAGFEGLAVQNWFS